MMYGFVLSEHTMQVVVPTGLVSHHRAFVRDVVGDDGLNGLTGGPVDLEAARAAAPLDESERDLLVPGARLGLLTAGLAADIGLIDLNDAAGTARGRCQRADAHCLANAMAH